MKREQQRPSLNQGALIFRHLDAARVIISRGFSVGGTPNMSMLTSYYALVVHLEAMLTMYMDDDFADEYQHLVDNLPKISTSWGNIQQNLNYFWACKKMFSLLIALAFKKGLLNPVPGNWDEELDVMEGIGVGNSSSAAPND